jgi:hypothetical protein
MEVVRPSLVLRVPVLDQRGPEATSLAARQGNLPQGAYLCGWMAMGVASLLSDFRLPTAAVPVSRLAALLSSLSDPAALLPHVEAAMLHTRAYREAYLLAMPGEFSDLGGGNAAAALTTSARWMRAWTSTWELCDWARARARSRPPPPAGAGLVGVARRVLVSPAAVPFLQRGVGQLHECERLFLGEEAPFRAEHDQGPRASNPVDFFPKSFAEVPHGTTTTGWDVAAVDVPPRRATCLTTFESLRGLREGDKGDGEGRATIPRAWLVDAEGHYVTALCVTVVGCAEDTEAIAALPGPLARVLSASPGPVSVALTLVLDSLPTSGVGTAIADSAAGRASAAHVLTLLRGIHAACFGGEAAPPVFLGEAGGAGRKEEGE